jgi:lipopolysaccharide transport system permease protein
MARAKDVVINANSSEWQYWKDIWNYKDLLIILAKRDILVRYKQTFIGAAWGLIRPLFTLIGFAFIFTKLSLNTQSTQVPYPIVAFSGILIWTYFSNSFLQISNSLVGNTALISKVYFPRIIMPISATFVILVDFLMALGLYFLLLLFFKVWPGIHILLMPLFVLHAFVLALGVGLIFAASNVKYRDFGQLAPFIIQFGLFICPIAYTHESLNLNGKLAIIYNLNPVVGLIDAFRWSVLPTGNAFPWQSFGISVSITFIILLVSVAYFRKREDKFVDYI